VAPLTPEGSEDLMRLVRFLQNVVLVAFWITAIWGAFVAAGFLLGWLAR
jgi:hypothetical protein